jgi:hypothetical protein
VPVLLLVGTFEPFDEGQAQSAGADAHLKKPFDSQELLTLVQQLLEHAAPAPAAEALAAVPAPAAAPAPAAPAPAPPAPAPPAPFSAEPEPAWGNLDLDHEPPAAPSAAPAPAEPPAASAASGRAAGFDWSDTSRFGRVDEQVFELEDTEDALGLDDSLLHDHPADHPDHLPDYAPLHAPDHEAEEPAAAAGPGGDGSSALPEDIGMPFPVATPAAPAISEPGPSLHDHEPPAPASAIAAPAPAPEPPAAHEPPAPSAAGPLSDADVDRIARRVVELLGDRAVRDVAWEVIPDMAEVVIKDRLRELESQVE